jgi:hypothetical protein
MKKSDEHRQSAENCTEMARTSASEQKRKRFERMAEGWQNVAKEQDWLDGTEEQKAG